MAVLISKNVCAGFGARGLAGGGTGFPTNFGPKPQFLYKNKYA